MRLLQIGRVVYPRHTQVRQDSGPALLLRVSRAKNVTHAEVECLGDVDRRDVFLAEFDREFDVGFVDPDSGLCEGDDGGLDKLVGCAFHPVEMCDGRRSGELAQGS